MKKGFRFCCIILFFSSSLFAQVAVNSDGAAPDNSALLDVKSNTKGALLPRMTQTQISLIVNPANGLIVFCTTDNKFYAYISAANAWREILYGGGTLVQFSCGSTFTINHTAGNVAPVSKTVTYGTVTNIPGEPSKCWITSNLGANHEAKAVDDASEASAGWYWQFNRKQGYKHDGSTRTPNTTWITSISENDNWKTANDPCTIELGTSWHIPAYTEWYNVDNTGGWTKWTGPWESGLKLHAAGYLRGPDASLGYRGLNGTYYSNSQYNNTNGWYLNFLIGESGVTNYSKAYGFSVRCLRDGGTALVPPTVTTSPVSNIAPTTATSGGNITSDGGGAVTARGVCLSASPNPTIAGNHTADGSGTGVFISNLVGMTPNTVYYIRAYATNCAGTSYGNELTLTTLPFSCGLPITVNHVAGVVAPVSKNATYGTVTNIPGELTKCWITSNLGADHQATAVNDTTEASAGWYWQFNHKQGFKHNGTNRTPNTLWISVISENSNWVSGNDPCSLELGSGWRIPTYSEWSNVFVAGGWLVGGYFTSGLKIHLAGDLEYTNGSLAGRGSIGVYHTSTQYDDTQSYELFLVLELSGINNSYKTYGSPLRCIRN